MKECTYEADPSTDHYPGIACMYASRVDPDILSSSDNTLKPQRDSMHLQTLLLSLLLFFMPGFNSSEQKPNSGEECKYSAELPRVEDYMRLITFADPYIGNFDADVTVIEYFDPNCQHCKALHPIMKDVVEANAHQARFFMIPFVLWQYSLPQVEALFVAGQDGKYFDMLDAQYENQRPGGMTTDDLIVLAKDIGLDMETFQTRLERGLNQRMILARRQEISDLGVRGTPALMINGRFVDSGSRSLTCINELIDKEVAALKQG